MLNWQRSEVLAVFGLLLALVTGLAAIHTVPDERKRRALSMLLVVAVIVGLLLLLAPELRNGRHQSDDKEADFTAPTIAQPKQSRRTIADDTQKQDSSNASPSTEKVDAVVPVSAISDSSTTSLPQAVMPLPVAEAEPSAPDGYHRGTIVSCQRESNVPGSAPKVCVEVDSRVVSAAIDSHLYIAIGGWRRRIPLYAGDVIRFEVRRGQIASAELLSDPGSR
jgi:hypothetical protein